jgi:hypothetical protein
LGLVSLKATVRQFRSEDDNKNKNIGQASTDIQNNMGKVVEISELIFTFSQFYQYTTAWTCTNVLHCDFAHWAPTG